MTDHETIHFVGRIILRGSVRLFHAIRRTARISFVMTFRVPQPAISQQIVEQLKEELNRLIDREKVIPEEILAELIKCLSHCGLLDGAPDDVDLSLPQIRAPLQQRRTGPGGSLSAR